MSTRMPSAWIASAKDNGRKSLKKISGKDTVYLNDNEEFLIELFNPLKFCVLADIKLNGSSISTSGIVLNPGQRFYLDCFVDSNRKFVFKTYDVEDTSEVMEAISNNGVLEVKFYKETVRNLTYWPQRNWYSGCYTNGIPTTNVYYSNNTTICGNNTSTLGDFTLTTSSFSNSDLTNCSSRSKSIETGRVESGDKSNQKFETVNMDFDSYSLSTTVVYMLPESRKPLEVVKKVINATDASDFVELIKKLGELHSAGLLTDDEFKIKKSDLLSRI